MAIGRQGYEARRAQEGWALLDDLIVDDLRVRPGSRPATRTQWRWDELRTVAVDVRR